MAADRGERRLQLVADREQERALGVLGPVEVVGEPVERVGERGDLGRALHRAAAPGRSPAASARLASETRSIGRATARASRKAAIAAIAAPTAAAIPKAIVNGCEVGGLELRRAQQDDRLLAARGCAA